MENFSDHYNQTQITRNTQDESIYIVNMYIQIMYTHTIKNIHSNGMKTLHLSSGFLTDFHANDTVKFLPISPKIYTQYTRYSLILFFF